jgi:hypothetical protein
MLLRLGLRNGDIDWAVTVARSARLVAAEDALYVEVAPARADALVRALAYAGIAVAEAAAPVPDPAAVPAIADSLDPLPRDIRALDVVWVDTVPLAVATRRALGAPIVRRFLPRGPRRARCRALLRGEEQLLAWERRVWISRAGLADPRVRRVVRPIVFDHAALQPDVRSHLCPRGSGQISRWAAT